MNEVYFFTRHIPFWGVPLLALGLEFGYLFWLRKKKKSATVCMIIALFGLVSIGFYYWAGGPEKSVKIIKKIHRDRF